MKRGVLKSGLSVLLSGCQTSPPNDIHWYRSAAERSAIYRETYLAATDAVRTAAAGLPAASWAVVLDVDETVLDNSLYQKRTADSGEGFSDKAWAAWVRERRAMPLPGALAFLHVVKDELHGQVILVTNRSANECADTEQNLEARAVPYDRILCAPFGTDGKPIYDKNPRFNSVLQGDAALGYQPLKVLAYVGDNIQDFPNLSQSNAETSDEFGRHYFVLPNPMYGSWLKLPYQ